MGDSKLTRLRAKLLRRSSASSAKAGTSPYNDEDTTTTKQGASNLTLDQNSEERQRRQSSSTKLQMSRIQSAPSPQKRRLSSLVNIPVENFEAINTPTENSPPVPLLTPSPSSSPLQPICPKVTLEGPTPEASRAGTSENIKEELVKATGEEDAEEPKLDDNPTEPQSQSQRPNLAQRRQSLVPYSQTRLIKTLLESERPPPTARSGTTDYFSGALPSIQANMIHRKIWVKRAGASATLVSIHEDDVVDDAREAVLRKYANSLGRSFDAPDVTLKIVSRDHSNRPGAGERVLGPEEPIGRTLDTYYPGGQTVEDALIIDVPQRRTPRPSPRQAHHMPYYLAENIAPGEGGEYFPPMPVTASSPHFAPSASVSSGQGSHHNSIHSMSVLTTGQVPALPSPGARGTRHPRRPNAVRQPTASPTVLSTASHSTPIADRKQSTINGIAEIPAPPPLPTPPAPLADATNPHKAVTPPARVSSPRPPQTKAKKSKKNSPPNELPSNNLPSGLLDTTIPPINVLIVEDNIINLKLLEAFMKRLKVRWQTAMNGREAVSKWRNGGFHLVLMDIQLPIMSGLEATKEIRRLERLNEIGAFSTSISDANTPTSATTLNSFDGPPKPDDILENASVFKSPVIIVALTASSLQSDRHEALAAGCNDFLTKPVNFVWLERKVTEWGCMQALIDYDGWRKWKDFSSPPLSAKVPKTKEHQAQSLNEALKAQQASAGNSSQGGAKSLSSREQSPVVQRVNSGLSNGSLGKAFKKGPPRRGNSIALARVDGEDEVE